MSFAIALGLVYIIVMPIVFRVVPSLVHKKLIIERKAAKAKANKAAMKDIPKPIWPRWSEHISFTMKDKRNLVLKKPKKGTKEEPKVSNIQNRQLFFMLWGAGLLVVLVGSFIGSWQVWLSGYVIFFVAMRFGVKSAETLLATRKAVIDRMFSIAKLKLGQSAEYTDNPKAVINILEWNDYVKPQKVELQVPDSFGADGEEGFMRQFNQIFGTETTWVPADDPETHAPGWNYEEGKVTIYAVPPLPQMAPWDEHYVLDPGVAWSFFPIALGVENGLEVPNPATGKIENVLGFDFSGEAGKAAKAAGYKMSGTITTSPMAFVGGGTGGGKSLSVDTLVEVVRSAA
jgi:hypothetical protein